MDEIISFCAMGAFLALAVLPWISALLGIVWLLAALQGKEAERAFRPVILFLVGVVFPFLVFMASYFLVPEWKGACRFGWLDCFHAGKLALTPLVLWACAAFVKYNRCKPEDPIPAWVVLGLFMGAVVSSVCVVVEFLVAGFRSWMWLVPCYVSVWYAKLALEARWSSGLPF